MKIIKHLPTGSLTVMAHIKAIKGYEKELEVHTKKLVQKVNAEEKGNLIYEAAWSVNEPNCIVFYEVFESEEAFALHKQAEHMMQWQHDTTGMREPTINAFVIENDMTF